jgi:uncharacterized membrane protein YkvA (DUF1232 family)
MENLRGFAIQSGLFSPARLLPSPAPPMTTRPATLEQYLATMADPGREATPSSHLERGAACVRLEDIERLRRMFPALRSKAARITDSDVLPRRINLLLQYVQETPAGANPPALREAAFVLFYFLKGFDLIPDAVPHVGLLDDAMLVDTALQRNAHELRAHWSAHGRAWPEMI